MTVPAGFLVANGSKFSIDGSDFRFAGTNNYYLVYATQTMIDDVFDDAKAMNLKVMRTWGFIDGTKQNSVVLQPSLGVYDEDGFKKFDYMLKKAGDSGIKVVLPFVNYWDDFGGMSQYVSWTGAGSKEAFYTNQSCKTAYKNYISYVLNRVNTYTQVKYMDDPTIMTWELANEPRCQSDTSGDTLYNWVKEMSSYIKSIDAYHLVAVGDEGFFKRTSSDGNYNGSQGVDWERLLTIDTIDYGTVHLYPDLWSETNDWGTQWIKDHIAAGKAVNKPVVIEEYGVKSDKDTVYKTWGDTVVDNGGAGIMFWLLTGVGFDGNLYSDYDGFRVTYPSSTATVLSSIANQMSGGSQPASTVSVQVTAPTKGQSFKYPSEASPITASATASTTSGTISSVIFYANGTQIGESTTSPYTITWYPTGYAQSSTGIDSYIITASATDSNGTSSTSAAITITVKLPVAPAGVFKIQAFNGNTTAAINTINPRFKISNTGSNAVDLSTVKVRYYYTIDTVQDQNFWCDYAGITSPSYQIITSSITGSFVKMDTPKTGADYYAEFGFTSAAGSLAAGGIVEIQTRFGKTDWSNYSQAEDYSFNASATTYADTSKIPLYISGQLSSGAEP